MIEPDIKFFLKILHIFQYCEFADEYSPLELEYKKDGPILYCCPMDPTSDQCYSLIFFSSKSDALKYLEIGNEVKVENNDYYNLIDHLDKNGVSGIMIFIEKPKGLRITALDTVGFGSFHTEEEVTDYYDYVLRFLNHRGLKISFFNKEVKKKYKLPVGLTKRIIDNAVKLYPKLLENEVIHNYDSELTGKNQYCLPVEGDEFNEKIEANYLIFPSDSDFNTYMDQFSELLNPSREIVEPNALLVEIYYDKDRYECNLEPVGTVKELNRDQQEEMVGGFLLEIERMMNSVLFDILKKARDRDPDS